VVQAQDDDGPDGDRDRGGPAVPYATDGQRRRRRSARIVVGRSRVHEHHLEDSGVVVDRDRTIEETRDGEGDEPSLSLYGGREQYELREKPYRERNAGER